MQGGCYGACQTDDLEGRDPFHSAHRLRTRIGDPEILEAILGTADAAEPFV